VKANTSRSLPGDRERMHLMPTIRECWRDMSELPRKILVNK